MREIERIVEISYRAPDGTRHASQEAADKHVETVEREAARTRVIDILRRPVSNEDRTALPVPHFLEEWTDLHAMVEASVHGGDVGTFYEKLADLIILRLDEVTSTVRHDADGPEDDGPAFG